MSAVPSEVGVLGVGIYLPEEVRTNDWWPESIVSQWREKPKKSLVRPDAGEGDVMTEGARRTLQSMAAYRDDPFKGGESRRVMPKTMRASDMELAACRDAIARWGGKASEIDLILVYSQLPDYLLVPNAPLLHRELGLSPNCISLDTNGACASYLIQHALAEQMIRGGAAKNALLVQSSNVQHICRPEDGHSIWFGDGATAVVLGRVSSGRGTLAWTHRTDGSFHKALMGGFPGKHWWESEQIYMYNEDRQCARNMLLLIADLAKDVIDESLAKAGQKPAEVNFYATHQSTLWFREATQDYMGLVNAKSFDSFKWTGSLGASNIPFMLGMGEREGLLKEGDLVAAYTGGSGITWSGAAIRWGR